MITLRLYKILKQIIYKINILNKNKIEIVKLWENASPTSAFQQQDKSVTLNATDMVIIQFNDDQKIMFLKVGDDTLYRGTRGNYFVQRSVKVTSSAISFGSGGWYNGYNTGSLNASGSYAIPFRIYIGKGVQ